MKDPRFADFVGLRQDDGRRVIGVVERRESRRVPVNQTENGAFVWQSAEEQRLIEMTSSGYRLEEVVDVRLLLELERQRGSRRVGNTRADVETFAGVESVCRRQVERAIVVPPLQNRQ